MTTSEVCNMENRLKKDRVWIKGQTLTAAQRSERLENNITALTVAFMGSMTGLFVLKAFQNKLLADAPLGLRAVLMVVLYWLVAVIPIMVAKQDGTTLSQLGFEKKGVVKQVLIGITLGAASSLVLTGVPHIAGFGRYVSSYLYTEPWQFAYQFVYCIAAVGAAEELVFRGVIYDKLNALFGRELYAAIGSSLLFGLFHIFGGSIVQVIFTAVIGFIFCTFRNKIKGCTLLSLMICHGVYDALICVWTYLSAR